MEYVSVFRASFSGTARIRQRSAQEPVILWWIKAGYKNRKKNYKSPRCNRETHIKHHQVSQTTLRRRTLLQPLSWWLMDTNTTTRVLQQVTGSPLTPKTPRLPPIGNQNNPVTRLPLRWSWSLDDGRERKRNIKTPSPSHGGNSSSSSSSLSRSGH